MSHLQINAEAQVVEYKVWDKAVRIFHWLNLFLVFTLLFVGLVMMFKSELGMTELTAKIKLKELHTVIGYLFAINLIIRLCWAFVGSKYAKFSNLLPKKNEITEYKESLKQAKPLQYIGHNPLGKIAVLLMLLCLTTIMASGLIRAGTDIYYPPFGGLVSQYVAADGINPATLVAYDDTGVNLEKSAQLKPYKSIIGRIHLYSVYLLMLLILLHVIGVIVAETRHQPGIVSAMISGKKWINGEAQDK